MHVNMDDFLIALYIALGIILFLIIFFIRNSRYCNRYVKVPRDRVTGLLEEKENNLNMEKRKSEQYQQPLPLNTIISTESLGRQKTETNEERVNDNMDLKMTTKYGKITGHYIEVKFPEILPSRFQQTTSKIVEKITTSRLWKFFNMHILIVVIIYIAAVIITTISTSELNDSAVYLLQSFNIAFTALYSVLIALIFQKAIEKNKENKKLFQALCGDIKAMAIWICALTDDTVKYKIDCGDEDDTKASCVEKGYQKIEASTNVETQFAKIRYLLSVLAPVAKHVLRNAEEPDNPTYDELDDKYRIRVTYSNNWWDRCGLVRGLQKSGFVAMNIETDTSQTWKKLSELADEAISFNNKPENRGKERKKPNMIKVYLYKKIKRVQQSSKMDLFETLMYCLLDEINRLREYKLGLTEKDYAKQRDLISKWQDIYGSWGPMASLTSYRIPGTVQYTMGISLLLYTISMSLYMKSQSLSKFNNPNVEDSWYTEEVSTNYINFYCIGLSFLQVFPIAWFYFLAERISQPFKKNNADSDIIDSDAKDTQEQVNKLMDNRAETDVKTLLEFDLGLDESVGSAFERDSIKTGELYKKKDTEIKKKAPRKSIMFGRGGMRPRNVIRYKNVNF